MVQLYDFSTAVSLNSFHRMKRSLGRSQVWPRLSPVRSDAPSRLFLSFSSCRAKGSSRKIPTSLPGRSTRQTVSTRVHSLSTRSREPFRTSLDLTDTYGTPGDMSILFLLGRRHGANHAMFEASALHRATMPSHATYRSVESARSRHGSMPQACTTLA